MCILTEQWAKSKRQVSLPLEFETMFI